MGARIGQVAAALCVGFFAGCTLGLRVEDPPSVRPSMLRSADGPTSDPAPEVPYVEADVQLDALARRFVTSALAYDAWTEGPRAFLTRLEDLATRAELQRLRRSERAHLRWWVLRQRFEQVTVRVAGVSAETASEERQTLHVEAVRSTRSSAATVRDFVEVTLVVVRTPQGWRVDDAEGGGL